MGIKWKIIPILWNKLRFSLAFSIVKTVRLFFYGLVLRLKDFFPSTCPPKIDAIEK